MTSRPPAVAACAGSVHAPGAGATGRVVSACLVLLLATLGTLPLPAADSPEADAEKKKSSPVMPEAAAAEKSPAKTETPKAAAAPESKASIQFPLKSEFFSNIRDGYDEQDEAMEINWEAMSDILIALKGSTQDDLLEHVNPEINFKKLMQEPASFRGEVVQLSGLLRRCVPAKFNPNPSGILEGWQGQLSTASGYIISFISLEPLPEDVKIGQGVKLVGLFMKRYAYEVKGQQVTWCPLVFTRTLLPFSELRQSEAQKGLWAINLPEVLFGLLVLVMLVIIFYHRSQQKMSRLNYFTRVKEARDGPPGNFPKPKKHAPPSKSAQ